MAKKYTPTNFTKKRGRELVIKNHFEKLNAIRIAYNENMGRWHEKFVMIFFRLGGYRNRISSFFMGRGIGRVAQFWFKLLFFIGFGIFLKINEIENKSILLFLFGIMILFSYAPLFAISQFIQSFASLHIDIVSNHPPIINVYSYGAWFNGVAMFFYKKNYDILGALFSMNSEREIDACKTLVYSNTISETNKKVKK